MPVARPRSLVSGMQQLLGVVDADGASRVGDDSGRDVGQIRTGSRTVDGADPAALNGLMGCQ